ncbi:tetratricopeptide (TPR) repeat protein [Azospirillum agricola]|uniref:tetratricopeptide repeat protein n=1 Tax=Azospirillum agricola TaxID=1720247 RepID=UPI001AE19474|nr:tetratricopeptide repeat protein [Azospirillum agricola]MBP2227151.1 tetratricopeptide (TPR) repeat protein [Azospirillum agricola]
MDSTLDTAIRHHQAGRYADAEPIYRTLLDRTPDNRKLLQLLGMLLSQTGRHGEAVDLFRQLIRLDPTAVAAYSNLAAALRTASRGADAILYLHRALALDPLHLGSWFNLANAEKQRGRAAAAARGYGHALVIDPQRADAATNLALLRDQWGERLDKAVRLAAMAKAAETDARLHTAAALALSAVGEVAATEAAARSALALDRADPVANRLLARALLDRSGAMEMRPGRPFAIDRALVEEAIAAFGRALAVHPGDEESEWLQTAAVATLVQVGQATDAVLAAGARTAWNRLRRHPKDVAAASVIGFHVYRRERLDLACWLNRRFQRRFTPQEIAREHELGLWAMLRADDAFFEALPPIEEALARMAPQEVIWAPEAGTPEPFVMFSCDDVYYRRFAPALLESLAQRMPGATVVAHVMSPSADALRSLEEWRNDPRLIVGSSCERPDTADWPDIKRFSYYAAARFIRTMQWQRRLDRPMIVIDVDATVTTDLRRLKTDLVGQDLGLLFDPRRRGPAREVTVCFNYYNNTAASARYLALVAAYIAHFLGRNEAYWMLDQTAHYAVFDWMRRRESLRVHRYDFLDFPHCHFVGDKR